MSCKAGEASGVDPNVELTAPVMSEYSSTIEALSVVVVAFTHPNCYHQNQLDTSMKAHRLAITNHILVDIILHANDYSIAVICKSVALGLSGIVDFGQDGLFEA